MDGVQTIPAFQEGILAEALRRLVDDLSREVSYLSAYNDALRKESIELRKPEALKHHPLGSSNWSLPEQRPAEERNSTQDPRGPRPFSPQPSSPHLRESIGDAGPPYPDQPHIRGLSLQKSQASLDERESNPAQNNDDEDEDQESTGRGPVYEQFYRIAGEGNSAISSYTLWDMVSKHEHELYGHNKHPRRLVTQTVRLIRKHYGAPDDLDFHQTPDPNTPQTPVMGRTTEVALMDFSTFQRFMADETVHRLCGTEEGGDTEYLKKALRAERANALAKKRKAELAEEEKEEVDPRPEGCLRVILETMPPPIIFLNAIVLGLQADIKSTVWEVLEMFFLAFYLVELVLKFAFLGCRRFFAGSEYRWNIFDSACVVVSLTDLGFRTAQWALDFEPNDSALNVLKFLRLARLARIIKSFRSAYFDDLKVMSLGILSGAKVLVWAVLLFGVCVFVLGVVMREIVSDQDEFRNVPSAMFSVFRCFTDGCSSYEGLPLHEKLRKSYGGLFMIPYILTFLIVNFGMFNLIVAVFIDRVVTITIKTKQQLLGERENEMRVAVEECLVELWREGGKKHNAELHKDKFKKLYKKGSRRKTQTQSDDIFTRAERAASAMNALRQEGATITRELFNTWLQDPAVLTLLDALEIDTATKSEIFDVCDVDKSGSLTCDELVNGLMRLRGPISKCDVIAIRLKVRYLTKIIEDMHHVLGA